jgi:sterol desaturase/sphingolipid hydroxylase (fatty acid hydroxylase superfamily)
VKDKRGKSMSEPAIRLISFAVIFSALALYEIWSPRLERNEFRGPLKSRRWLTNISILVISSLALRVIFPLAAVGAAVWASQKGYGFLPWLGMPEWLTGVIAFVLLDFAVWLEHVASHKVPLFWRIHRMHHADTGFDVTTALRFHPFEIVLSMFWKALVIAAIGAPPLAVLVFEIVLNGSSMFNHANISLPLKIDRLLRKIIVTPDMHRIHHSAQRSETDSNYGFNFAFWDRIFRTYNDLPAKGQEQIDIGLPAWRDEKPANLLWSLRLPFRK